MISVWWWEKVPTWPLRGWVTPAPQLASDLLVFTPVTGVDTRFTAMREGVEAFMARPPGITHG